MAEKEYIDRATPLAEYDRVHVGPPGGARKLIEEAPVADVAEVVHGTWRFEHDPITDPKGYFIRIVCSCCRLKTGQVSNYCPNCGAKMDGKVTQE